MVLFGRTWCVQCSCGCSQKNDPIKENNPLKQAGDAGFTSTSVSHRITVYFERQVGGKSK